MNHSRKFEIIFNPAANYMFKANYRNTRTK